MISLLGCAESVLANSNQKHLSVHEILDGIMQSDLNQLTSANAYASLASALFSEIQKPGSKFERNGNKFTLRKDVETSINQLSDIVLCTRRRRRTTTSRTTSFSDSPPQMVKLSTTTNPPGRTRANSTMNNLNDTFSKKTLAFSKSNTSHKQVRFALERNEIFLFVQEPEELHPFPSLS